MKIPNTSAAINRAIAEILGFRYERHGSMSATWHVPGCDRSGFLTPCTLVTGEWLKCSFPEPDFLTDWSATGLLQMRPEFSQVDKFEPGDDWEDADRRCSAGGHFGGKAFYGVMFCSEPGHSNGTHDTVYVEDVDQQRAICLGFLKAHGVGVEDAQ